MARTHNQHGRRIKDNSARKFPGEHGPRPDKAATKRKEAAERQARSNASKGA
jgi:hypothetical protein